MSSRLSVRKSQLITPFGVGSICEIDGQSFIIKDISRWPSNRMEAVKLDRITSRLSEAGRLKAPVKNVPVPAARFPRWLFCPTCRSMHKWKYTMDMVDDEVEETPRPTCSNHRCQKASLVPMRFVQVCDGGHVDDINWHWWAHKNSQQARTGTCSPQSARLSFFMRGERGGDFDSMKISCSCGASNTLEGIADGPIGKCSGRQPWTKPGDCVEPAFMEPRGSAALHYASTLSALDISVGENVGESVREKVLAHPLFADVIGPARQLHIDPSDKESVRLIRAQLQIIVGDIGEDDDDVWDIFREELGQDQPVQVSPGTRELGASELQKEILGDEFTVLASPVNTPKGPLVRRVHLLDKDSPLGLNRFFCKIVQVESLRVVRVFRGFQRRDVTGGNAMVEADLGSQQGWLPAVDVRGEGIFLEFNKPGMEGWLEENRDAVEGWVSPQLSAGEKAGLAERFSTQLNTAFLMIHSLSHLLINQLSFDCGYSSTSLRERLYCGPEDNLYGGVLVYTADSDAEGSMGGLVEMGDPERFSEVVYRAVSRSRWCSGDPVCRELPQQGMHGFNRAACHACCLVAETSCTHANTLLNRVLVSGDGRKNGRGGVEPMGFLHPLLSV